MKATCPTRMLGCLDGRIPCLNCRFQSGGFKWGPNPLAPEREAVSQVPHLSRSRTLYRRSP